MPIYLGTSGVVAAIGAGGKTTLLNALAQANAHRRVLLTTTTHIRPFSAYPLLAAPSADELIGALAHPGVVCAGTPAPEGKLTSLSPALLKIAHSHAQLLLYEGDGARELPLKLHRPHEPVLLPETDLCVILAGLSALGQPVSQCIHCWSLRPEWKQDPGHPVDIIDVFYCIQDAMNAAGLSNNQYHVFLNQADTPFLNEMGEQLRSTLLSMGVACTVGSLASLVHK